MQSCLLIKCPSSPFKTLSSGGLLHTTSPPPSLESPLTPSLPVNLVGRISVATGQFSILPKPTSGRSHIFSGLCGVEVSLLLKPRSNSPLFHQPKQLPRISSCPSHLLGWKLDPSLPCLQTPRCILDFPSSLVEAHSP